MYQWVGTVAAIIGVVLVLGLLLKDANQFNTLLGALNSTIGTLENAGGSGGGFPSLSVPSVP